VQRQGRASEGGLVKVRTARETCDVDVGGSGGAFIPEHLPFEARRNQVIQLPPSLPPSLVTSSSTPSPFLSLYCPSVLRVVPFRAQSTPPHRRAILGRRGRRGLSTRSPSSPAECRKTCLGTTCRPDRPRLLVHLVRLDLRLTRLHAVCYDAPCLPAAMPSYHSILSDLCVRPFVVPCCTYADSPCSFPPLLPRWLVADVRTQAAAAFEAPKTPPATNAPSRPSAKQQSLAKKYSDAVARLEAETRLCDEDPLR